MQGYDDWAMNGNWHTCICGARWSDSDGGPCHEECTSCGEACEGLDEDERCEECALVKCNSCKEKLDKEEINDAGYCEYCQDGIDSAKSSEFKDLPKMLSELEDIPAAMEILRKRLARLPLDGELKA